ncbi:GNAT family N-acetyltransferase [Priestia megaterium]|uniref:GNAT family N-acetyltransferase n=1 Tax=Priestia megaterium TaxID=1404 RepID=UPI000D51D8FC|nr:GNAT family N-acetyltransferase [Priestia megaterium]PVE72704.1 GNAT family N-acetyltransferase [Priestia megaterium]PVE89493.1 GNAT family N-acetyltransferase [Priestia megaterium]PVE90861.1 GNAT family N-acetyltransferase [Priestia megaterium]PVF00340.1 GNAT family N-acetyltransferase [Priestia megaterium]
MTITYKTNVLIRAEQAAEVFVHSGIKRPVQDLDRIQRMLDYASLTITAWNGSELIGIARALTDFSYCCYLSDLAVAKDYQKQGIGTQLIKHVQSEIGEETALILLSAPSAMNYYPKAGFHQIDNGFKIGRIR